MGLGNACAHPQACLPTVAGCPLAHISTPCPGIGDFGAVAGGLAMSLLAGVAVPVTRPSPSSYHRPLSSLRDASLLLLGQYGGLSLTYRISLLFSSSGLAPMRWRTSRIWDLGARSGTVMPRRHARIRRRRPMADLHPPHACWRRRGCAAAVRLTKFPSGSWRKLARLTSVGAASLLGHLLAPSTISVTMAFFG